MASSFGVKLGSYPVDVLRKNENGKVQGQLMEIDRNISGLKRQRLTNSISYEEFQDKAKDQLEKKREVMKKFREKTSG